MKDPLGVEHQTFPRGLLVEFDLLDDQIWQLERHTDPAVDVGRDSQLDSQLGLTFACRAQRVESVDRILGWAGGFGVTIVPSPQKIFVAKAEHLAQLAGFVGKQVYVGGRGMVFRRKLPRFGLPRIRGWGVLGSRTREPQQRQTQGDKTGKLWRGTHGGRSEKQFPHPVHDAAKRTNSADGEELLTGGSYYLAKTHCTQPPGRPTAFPWPDALPGPFYFHRYLPLEIITGSKLRCSSGVAAAR